MENECFSGNSGKINGAISLYGTTFTSGALFGQVAGIPLKTETNSGGVSDNTLFKNTIMLGDVLKSEGYHNVFLLGSPASFAGKSSLFSYHGDYSIFDYYYAVDNNWISGGFRNTWGYEDKDLYANAKSVLTELSKADEPFNLTIETVDTHFEDGYPCNLCPKNEYDEQYAYVMACSSKQISDLLVWVKQQDFYDDTVIVLAGDHPTMDSDFCDDVPNDYERKAYLSIINSDTICDNPNLRREYSTLDMYPTTLAALGAEIEGNRLGLGTNLYSREQTLVERDGIDTINTEFKKKSAFLDELQTIDYSESASNTYANISVFSRDFGQKLLTAKLNLPGQNDEIFTRYYVEFISPIGNIVTRKLDSQSNVFCKIILDLNNCKEITGIYAMRDDSNIKYQIPCNLSSANLQLYHDNLKNYLNYVKDNGNYYTIISINNKDDGSDSINFLNELSICNVNDDSNALVLNNGIVINKSSLNKTRLSGQLNNDISYEITRKKSSDTDVICVNNVEYINNKSGIFILVYDEESNNVIDSAVFDINSGREIPQYSYEEYCKVVNSIPMGISELWYNEETDEYNIDMTIDPNNDVNVLNTYATFLDIEGNPIYGMRYKSYKFKNDFYYIKGKANFVAKHIKQPYSIVFDIEIAETDKLIRYNNLVWSFAEYFN